jgi:hypothetical protein
MRGASRAAKQERTSRVINVQDASIEVYYSRHGQKGLFPATGCLRDSICSRGLLS